MRRFLVFLVFIPVTAFSQTVTQDLIGLGMPSEQAEYLASILPAGSVAGNAVWIKGRNQANSADINMLRIDTGDNTVLNSSASDTLILQLEDDANRLINFSAASDTAMRMFFGDGTTSAQTLIIGAGTGTTDDGAITIAGGNTAIDTDGAWITAYGDNHASAAGELDLNTSSASGADIFYRVNSSNGDHRFYANGTPLFDVQSDGDLYVRVGNIISDVQDKGLQILSGASLHSDITTSLAPTTSTNAYFTVNGPASTTAWIQNTADANGTQMLFFKTRAAANSTNADTIIASSDKIVEFVAYAADGADYKTSSMIRMSVDASPGTNDVPGRITFFTAPDGSSNLTEALQINSSQNTVAAGTITSSRTTDLGWVSYTGLTNATCNTTCTSACVIGMDTDGAKTTFVACSAATAENCLCAGAS